MAGNVMINDTSKY